MSLLLSLLALLTWKRIPGERPEENAPGSGSKA
jgi:hypothetical protein